MSPDCFEQCKLQGGGGKKLAGRKAFGYLVLPIASFSVSFQN